MRRSCLANTGINLDNETPRGNEDTFLTLSQAAALLKVSKSSLRRWSNTGDLRCFRIGRRGERRFRRDDLMGLVRMNPADTVPNKHTRAHICTNFRDRDEQWRLFQPYLNAHLYDDSAIVYVYEGSIHRIQAWFSNNPAASRLIQTDRLRLISSRDSYLRQQRFDTERMLNFWKVLIEEFQNKNIHRLLLTGEMGWATLGAPGSNQLIFYEKELDQFLKAYPSITVVCQYSLIDFPATVIFDSVRLHPTVLPAMT